MILRQSGKENRSAPHILKKIQTGLRVITLQDSPPYLERSQEHTSGNSQLTIDTVNLEVFQKQLNRIQNAYENERKENWMNCQEKVRLENQVRVLQIQRDNQYQENEKLRYQIKDLLAKLKQSQAKSNTHLSQYYGFQNQMKNLQYQVKKFEQISKISQQKLEKTQFYNSQLQTQIADLNSGFSQAMNDFKSKDMEVSRLINRLEQLQIQNRGLTQKLQEKSKISTRQAQKIYKQLDNWKNAFQKKQRELEKKTSVLSQENEMMKKTIDQLSKQLETKPNAGLSKSLSWSIQESKETNSSRNEYHIRLFIKETQIQKLNAKVKQLQQKIQTLEVQNSFLQKRTNQKSLLSPKGYQRYTDIQTTIFKNSQVKKQVIDLRIQLQSKQKEIEILQESISEKNRELEYSLNELKKLQSQLEHERIYHGNSVNELTGRKNRLERDLQLMKVKAETLSKQCLQKDRIIMNYVNMSKQKGY